MMRPRPSRFGSRGARPGSLRWASWPLAALAALTLLVPVWHRPAENANGGSDHLRQPSGYTERVNALIEEGYLRPRDEGLGYVRNSEWRAANASFSTKLGKFQRASFLGRDLDSESGMVWTAEGIDPNAHREVGPADDIVRWEGDLKFQPIDRVLEPGTGDNGPTLELIDIVSSTSWLIGPGGAIGDPDQEAVINLLAKPPEEGLSARSIKFAGASGEIQLTLVGNQPLIRLIGPGRGGEPGSIWINGEPVKWEASGPFAERLIPLMPDGLGKQRQLPVDLDIVAPGKSPRRFRLLERAPLISSFRPGGKMETSNNRSVSSLRRYHEGLESFARPIEAQMRQGPLQTTLIEELQSAGQKALTGQAVKVLEGRLKRGERAFSFRASATLMDGITGEIVALPSWPVQAEDLVEETRDQPDAARMFEQNNNFVRQPVGSTAKVPFAMAIVQRFPELTQLKLSSNGPFGCFMGWPKSAITDEHGTGKDLSLAQFVARSSNRYAMSLMMLGTIEAGDGEGLPLQREPSWSPLCRGETYLIGANRFLAHPPYGARVGTGRGEWDRTTELGPKPVGRAWTNNLARFFCIEPEAERTSTLGPGCAADLWGEGSPMAGKKVNEIPRVQLGFNLVGQLYGDYLMTILGGAESRWSTIHLAQAYARLVSGVAVQPTLSPDPKRKMPERLNFHAGARQELLTGMRQVFTMGEPWNGTAGGLHETLAKLGQPQDAATFSLSDGSTIRFYGKTGTPTVIPLSGYTEPAKLLLAFARSRCGLRGTPLGEGGARIFVGTDGVNARDAILASKGQNCRKFATAGTAAQIASEVKAINGDQKLFQSVVLAPDGRILKLPMRRKPAPRDADGGEPGGRLFVLVAARYSKGSGRLCSVSTIASNFQSKAGGSPALNFTGTLLQDPAVKAWLGRGRNECARVRL